MLIFLIKLKKKDTLFELKVDFYMQIYNLNVKQQNLHWSYHSLRVCYYIGNVMLK
jgi:hypothetical protein